MTRGWGGPWNLSANTGNDSNVQMLQRFAATFEVTVHFLTSPMRSFETVNLYTLPVKGLDILLL